MTNMSLFDDSKYIIETEEWAIHIGSHKIITIYHSCYKNINLKHTGRWGQHYSKSSLVCYWCGEIIPKEIQFLIEFTLT